MPDARRASDPESILMLNAFTQVPAFAVTRNYFFTNNEGYGAIPVSVTTFLQRAISSVTIALNSAGVLPTGVLA
jgi:hypothetical protein